MHYIEGLRRWLSAHEHEDLSSSPNTYSLKMHVTSMSQPATFLAVTYLSIKALKIPGICSLLSLSQVCFCIFLIPTTTTHAPFFSFLGTSVDWDTVSPWQPGKDAFQGPVQAGLWGCPQPSQTMCLERGCCPWQTTQHTYNGLTKPAQLQAAPQESGTARGCFEMPKSNVHGPTKLEVNGISRVLGTTGGSLILTLRGSLSTGF